jgi:CubicO group peptidase (beta-lactamase class C family)/endonuclease/exonuclease/phosphatase family metal-dependent hydrolase/dienelactone hydrolase
MKKVLYKVLILAIALVSLGGFGNIVRDTIQAYVDRKEIAGVVSVLSDKEGNITTDAVGWADYENKRPMSDDTLFAIFSMTKTFTGASIMVAIDEGKISLDDKVSKYLPEFKDMKMKDGSPLKRELTIRDLMSHVTGARGGEPFGKYPIREVAKRFAAKPLVAQPGETFSYGNDWINSAAAALEIATGVAFEDWLQKKILDPLGMVDTTFWPNEEQSKRLVKPYTSRGGIFTNANDRLIQRIKLSFQEKVYPMPSGGLFSTPRDMIKFSQMLANHGTYKGKTIISRKTFDEIFAVKQTPENISQAYTVGSWLHGDWFGHEGALRTDQQVNLKNGCARVFFIQTENRAGRAFFDLKRDWHNAADEFQKSKPLYEKPIVRMMSYNIWGEYFKNPTVEREDDVFETIIKERPDIVSIQEACLSWWTKSKLFPRLEEAGWNVVTASVQKAEQEGMWHITKSGKATLNHQPILYLRDKFDLLDSGFSYFHLPIDTKGVTWAVLVDKRTRQGYIVFATHLWWKGTKGESDAIREMNASLICRKLEELKKLYPYPVIGGGDLNSLPGSWAHKMFNAYGYESASLVAETKDKTPTHHGNPKKGDDGKWHGNKPAANGISLDYIFVETNSICALTHKVVVDQKALDTSDHSPVVVTFRSKSDALIEGAWKNKGLEKTPRVHPCPEMNTNGTKAVFIESVSWKGKQTRFFAYYSLPEGASKDKPVPGVVLVHGGGGTAFTKYIKYWNSLGYAAIAMDTCGSIPVNEPGKPGGGEHSNNWKSHAFSGPRGWGGFADSILPYQDQWPYHAVASVIVSHSFLRSFEEVDSSRIGISGVSWGGFLTCIAGSVDRRFRWANPIYGCGFLAENSAWKKTLNDGEKGKRYSSLWDPSIYLGEARCPYFWVSGQNDRFYPFDSLMKSASLVDRSYYNVPEKFGHSHKGFLHPEIPKFAEAMNNGKEFPVNLPK